MDGSLWTPWGGAASEKNHLAIFVFYLASSYAERVFAMRTKRVSCPASNPTGITNFLQLSDVRMTT
jgi:hypothetical protein